MSAKARQFRSLLLESLECRSVFSVDGFEVWQFSFIPVDFEANRFHAAHYPHTGSESLDRGINNQSLATRDGGDLDRRLNRGPSIHRGRVNEHSEDALPPAEGEGHIAGAHLPSFDSKPTSFDSKPTQVQIPTKSQPVAIADSKPPLVVNAPSRNSPVASLPPRTQVDSSSSNNFPTNVSTGNGVVGRSLISQNLTTAPVAPVNLSNASSTAISTTTPTLSVTTFDFSSRRGIISDPSAASKIGDQRTNDFRFTRPLPVPADSILDQSLAEQPTRVAALESLLSTLAENHRRSRQQNGLDANEPNARGAQSWRPENAVSAEIAFTDGGMIALVLNRDIATSDIDEIAKVASSENQAWIANVGIFRAVENVAVAATEYAGLTNRITRNEQSRSTMEALSEVEGEVANSQLHPLLASTSALLGAVMLGLRRRIRKVSPLQFTSRKR